MAVTNTNFYYNTTINGSATAGALSCGSLTNTGTLSSTSAATMGALSCSTIATSSGIVCGALTSSGQIVGGSITSSGAFTCGTNSATVGALSCSSLNNTGTMSSTNAATMGALTCSTITNSSGLVCGALTSSGPINIGAECFMKTNGFAAYRILNSSNSVVPELCDFGYVKNDTEFFPNSLKGDMILRTTSSDGRILIGVDHTHNAFTYVTASSFAIDNGQFARVSSSGGMYNPPIETIYVGMPGMLELRGSNDVGHGIGVLFNSSCNGVNRRWRTVCYGSDGSYRIRDDTASTDRLLISASGTITGNNYDSLKIGKGGIDIYSDTAPGNSVRFFSSSNPSFERASIAISMEATNYFTNSSANDLCIRNNNSSGRILLGVGGTRACVAITASSFALTDSSGYGMYNPPSELGYNNIKGLLELRTDDSGHACGILMNSLYPGLTRRWRAVCTCNNGSYVIRDDTAGADRFTIDTAGKVTISGSCDVVGNLTKGSGSFLIDHPDPAKPGWKLRHCFVESNTCGDNLYRFEITTHNLTGTISLPSYFKYINENVQIFVSAKNGLGTGYGIMDEACENLTINTSIDGIYNVLLIGTRSDKIAHDVWDEHGAEVPP